MLSHLTATLLSLLLLLKIERGERGCPSALSKNTFLIPPKVITRCWDTQRGGRIRDLQERKIKITLICLRCAVFF